MERKISSTFTIQGILSYKDKPEFKQFESHKKTHWKGGAFQVGIKVDNGLHYVKFFGGDSYKDAGFKKLDDIKYTQDGNQIVLTEEQVRNQAVFENIPQYKKTRFNDKQYVYAGEFVSEVYDNIEVLKDKLVTVYGKVTFTYSKEKDMVYKEFSATSIKLTENQDDEHFATGNMQFVFNECSLDESIIGSNGFNKELIKELGNKIPLIGYVPQYNQDELTRDSVQDLFYPIEVSIRTDKLDLDEPLHQQILKYMVGQCVVGKNKKPVTCGFKVVFKKGNSEIELTEEQKKSMLTRDEMEYIKLFPQMEEDFLKKKLQVTSERINEVYLSVPHPSLPAKEEVEDVNNDILELYKTIGVYEKEKSKVTKKETKAVKKDEEVEDTTGGVNFDDFFGGK